MRKLTRTPSLSKAKGTTFIQLVAQQLVEFHPHPFVELKSILSSSSTLIKCLQNIFKIHTNPIHDNVQILPRKVVPNAMDKEEHGYNQIRKIQIL